MTTFSIDDVRETFHNDMTSLLARVDDAARVLDASVPPDLSAGLDSYRGLFQTIAHATHAVSGSSGLIRVTSMHETARSLEELTDRAEAALAAAIATLARARDLAGVCSESAADLRRMLALELEHRSEEALRVADRAAMRVSAFEQSGVEELEPPVSLGPAPEEEEEEFTFSMAPPPARDDGAGGDAQRRARGITLELVSVFREEAQELVRELVGQLALLRSEPTNLNVIGNVERIYHTMKGAAATVGLAEISDSAASLHRRVEGVVEGTATVTEGFLKDLYRDTNSILQQADLPSLSVPDSVDSASGRPQSGSASSDSVDREVVAVFRKEVHDSLVSLTAHIETLAAHPEDTTLLGHIDRIFHTLKGAAATVGLTQVSRLTGAIVADLGAVLDARISVTPAFLRKLVTSTNHLLKSAGLPEVSSSIFSRIGAASESESARPAEFSFAEEPREQDAGLANELYSIFQQEARESLVALKGHLQSLGRGSDDASALDHVERIFHTLKGAAATVGLPEVSALCESLRQRTERASDGVGRDPDLHRDLLEGTKRLLAEAGLGEFDAPREPTDKGAGLSDTQVARRYFLSEAKEICEQAMKLAPQLRADAPERSREVRAELSRLFHRLKGSAVVTTDERVVDEAERLQKLFSSNAVQTPEALTESIRTIVERLGIRLDPASVAPPPVDPAPVVMRVKVEVPKEPELWDTFNQECIELLDSIDKAILELESSDQPKRAVEQLLRLVHTLKGAVNTIGLTPTGLEIHRVEDFLESLMRMPVLPALRGVATFLLKVQGGLRRALSQATTGYVETSLPRIEAQIAAILRHSRPPPMDSASARSGESASGDDSGGRAMDPAGPDRKFIRVPAERLDSLMNLAGELVVSRSRLMNRVGVLKVLQRDLSHSRRQLLDTVDRFREEHEFSMLGARFKAETLRAVPEVRPDSMHQTAWSSFSELELDRYDDVNVLSRSLAEISDDVNEASGLLFRELAGFADDSDQFGTIANGIQSEVTRARMVPLEFVFGRLRLPIRDAAEREGKEVRVVTQGEDVSLDKTIADALFTPMLHLVRNAVVHGIESAGRREGARKPRIGVITLLAREESGQIVLEVRDDGGGLDLAALKARAVKMGILAPDLPATDPAVRELVFAAGLSTRAAAGAVSGRGVGGDIVKRSIERLNGGVRVETQEGRGTTFIVTLPLTLAITRALLVRSQSRSYAIPLHFAERILDFADTSVVSSGSGRRLKLDGAFLAMKHVSDALRPDAPRGDGAGPVVVLRVGAQRMALQVDEVVSQEEIVVKGLGDMLDGHPLFAGVTIRGTGELVLILDAPALVESRTLRQVVQAAPEREMRQFVRSAD